MWGSLRLGILVAAKFNSSPATHMRKKFCCGIISTQIRRFCSPVNPDSSNKIKEMTLDEIAEELCKGDAYLEKRLRVLMLEVEVIRQDGRQAPCKLTLRNWNYLLNLETRSQRIKYLSYLFKIEKSVENRKAKKAERKKYLEENPRPEKDNPDDMVYGLVDNAMFLRIRDTSISNFDNYRALQATMYGLPLIIDCSYEENMVPRENINAAKQLTFLFGDNRIHRDPFDIHLCNVNMDGMLMKQFEINVPPLREPWFPLHLHEKSYLDLFPKDKLVYLTPHCREEIVEFDPEAIYIIGCMVDKTNNEPLSLAKAKRDGIKMAKLPLDRYIEWAPGSGKCLNINHMLLILLDLKFTGDWKYALRHVPRRKLMSYKLEAVKKNIEKYHPKYVESLSSPWPKNKYKPSPRMYAGKLNIKSLFNEDNKY